MNGLAHRASQALEQNDAYEAATLLWLWGPEKMSELMGQSHERLVGQVEELTEPPGQTRPPRGSRVPGWPHTCQSDDRQRRTSEREHFYYCPRCGLWLCHLTPCFPPDCHHCVFWKSCILIL